MHDASCHNLGWCHCDLRTASFFFFWQQQRPRWTLSSMWPDSSLQLFERPSGHAFTAWIQQSESHVFPNVFLWELQQNRTIHYLDNGFKCFLFSPRSLRKWSNLTIIWVVQPPTSCKVSLCDIIISKFARKPKLREELEEKIKAQHEQNHQLRCFHSHMGVS